MATTIRRVGSIYADNVITSIITLPASTLEAGSSTTFTIDNPSSITNSIVIGSIEGYSGTTGIPIVRLGNVSNGTFNITLINAHGTLALNGIVKVSVLVI